MFHKIKQWREKRILANSPYTIQTWQQIWKELSVLNQLDEKQQGRLFELATLFLHQKEITGAHEFEVTDIVKQSIALQACLPILNLGLEWYKGWTSVIVYPAAFRRESTEIDEFGVAHTKSHNLSGEAWLRGPVVLAWTDTEHAGARDGHNVVIHEFVHKLDMLNGRANGFPPMQPGMDHKAWAEVMSNSFADFQVNKKEGLDLYGATNPAEFFSRYLAKYFSKHPICCLKPIQKCMSYVRVLCAASAMRHKLLTLALPCIASTSLRTIVVVPPACPPCRPRAG